jgi:hypothetical protein
VSSIGWNASGPLALTVLAAGHEAGLYCVGVDLITRTLATAGGLQRTTSYNAPTFGATSTGTQNTFASGVSSGSTGRPPTTTGNVNSIYFFMPTFVRSDGSAAIVTTITPVGITGSPVIDVYASAIRVG